MPKKDRYRVNIDTDEDIQGFIARLAKLLKVPISQVWNYFAYRGAMEIEDEESDIWDRLRETGKSGYKNMIDLDDLKRKLRGDD